MSILCKNFQKFANRLYSSSSYVSAISIGNLYPGSRLKLTTPTQPPNEAEKNFTGFIPIDQLDITYSRSSGPGGQNVNKINTKVEIRFHVQSAKWIDEDIKTKLADKLKNKITKEGYVIFRSDVTRSQQLNLADCLEKIRATVRDCAQTDAKYSEETAEKIRRRIEKAAQERLAVKRIRSQIKSDRQDPVANL